MLAGQGTEFTDRHELKSLKWIGSVGEPIDPTAWEWYYENVGKGRCPLCDTWWQTETGGHLISPLPGASTLKPGFRQPAVLRREDQGPQREGRGVRAPAKTAPSASPSRGRA